MNRAIVSAVAAAALSTLTAVLPQSLRADPPARVGRVSYLQGAVTFAAEAGGAWQPLILNYPVTTGNQISTAEGARAEVQIGSAALRLGPDTLVTLEALDDQAVQVRLDHGRAGVRLRTLGPNETFQLDIPTASISFGAPGRYRVDQPESGDAELVAWEGDAEVTGGQASFHVLAGQAAPIPSSGPDAALVASAPSPDDWDHWAADRDGRGADVASTRYVSREMDGVEDLDSYGTWRIIAGYGAVWIPSDVPAGWAPYAFGRWVWVEPWGWTWVDNAPWGFAPFHYGRWILSFGAWCWVPGPIVVRPVYAPALVYWSGGIPPRAHPPDFGHSTWMPLRPGQAFHPPYAASRPYVLAINGAARIPPRPPGPRFPAATGMPLAPRPGFIGIAPRPGVRLAPPTSVPRYRGPAQPSFVPPHPSTPQAIPPQFLPGRGRHPPRRGGGNDPWWLYPQDY